jgi:hypothetical protein
MDLFVTEAGKINVSDLKNSKILASHPSSTTFTEVLRCPSPFRPHGLLVHDRSLYVSMVGANNRIICE